MKQITITLLVLFSLAAFSQQMSYDEWKAEAKNDIRLLPEYGNVEKSKEQKAADEELIETILKLDTTREKGSRHMVELGFKYVNKGDLKTAMSRFNQAWLLNKKNENVFWGFGAIYFAFSDFDNAMKQYDKGLAMNPNNPNLLTDKATIYLGSYYKSKEPGQLNMALDLFKKSYQANPKNSVTLFKLSVCYFLKDDCTNALKYYKTCESLGGKDVNKEYAVSLHQKCGDK